MRSLLFLQRPCRTAATSRACIPAPCLLRRLSHRAAGIAHIPSNGVGDLSARAYSSITAGHRHRLKQRSSFSEITRKPLAAWSAHTLNSAIRNSSTAAMSNGVTAKAAKPVLFLYGIQSSPCLLASTNPVTSDIDNCLYSRSEIAASEHFFDANRY